MAKAYDGRTDLNSVCDSRTDSNSVPCEALTGAYTPAPNEAVPLAGDRGETGAYTPAPEPLEHEERLDELVVSYLEAVQSGARPDPRAWAARYPDCATELGEFLSDQDQFQSWTQPL